MLYFLLVPRRKEQTHSGKQQKAEKGGKASGGGVDLVPNWREVVGK